MNGNAAGVFESLFGNESRTGHFSEEFATAIMQDDSLNEKVKEKVLRNLARLRDTKVNILFVGPTGCGKSSTINALFDADKAKVGQGADPETMDIARYDMENIVLFDSPGLGDSKEADRRHAKAIMEKLLEKDSDGDFLIDLVLVILDGGGRDFGTVFSLINEVIIPNLGDDKSRLLIAINQADQAMKGRGWDKEANQPEPILIEFLDEKVDSTKRRIREATGVDVDVVCYAAGYKEGDAKQNPWNLSKLLAFILRHTKEEKRAAFAQDINKSQEVWKDDDRQEDYKKEIKESFLESVGKGAATGAAIGASVGRFLGPKGVAIGTAVGTVAGAILGGIKSFFG